MDAPDPGRLARLIDHAFEHEALDALARYTEIRCLSPAFDRDWQARGELARAAALLADYLRARRLDGARIEIIELPGRTPVVLGEFPATDPARAGSTTLVYGHFDKQPPLGAWRAGLDPFGLVREGERAYGRGTADDGYATFAAAHALGALDSLGVRRGRVVVLLESSEESASNDLDAYLDHLAGRLGRPGLVVCLDAGCVSYDRLWTTSSLRGNLVVTLRVDVLSEGVHSGSAGGIVPSSFRICRALLDRVEDAASGTVLLPSCQTAIPEHRAAEIAALAEEFGEAAAGVFPAPAGLELAGTSLAERIENGTWRACLALIGVDGVPSVAEGGNVLRPYTALKLSLRLPPNCDARRALAELEATLRADPPAGATVRVEAEAPAAGWDAPSADPWLARALDAASRAYFGAPPRAMGLGGSIPFMAALGERFTDAQYLATGVLGPGSNAHGPNEFLHLPTAKALTASLAHLLALAP